MVFTSTCFTMEPVHALSLSLSGFHSSDSESHFETPEASTPVHAPSTFPEELENNNTDADKTDVDQEEQLIVTAPVLDQDFWLSHNMGQDEPVAPMGGLLEVNFESLPARQPENLPEALGSAPAPSLVNEEPEVPECTAKPLADPEPQCNGLDQTEPPQKTKHRKSKPPSLEVKASVDEPPQTIEEQELPLPKATYKFDPDQLDDGFNPFTCGGSKIQNSPPPFGSSSFPRLEPIGCSLPACEDSAAPPVEAELSLSSSSEAKSVMLEFGLDEGTVTKPPPRKLGVKKKLAAKKKAKASEASSKPAPEPVSKPAPEPIITEPVLNQHQNQFLNKHQNPLSQNQFLNQHQNPLSQNQFLYQYDIPIPKSGAYNFDPNQWDDPNFNPFGSNSTASSSPVLPKSSYSFDPDNFDDSVDPFKSSKNTTNEDSSSSAPQPEKKVKDVGKPKVVKPAGEKKARQIPKKDKERAIDPGTSEQVKFLCFLLNSCKVQKYDESQSLVLEVCDQGEQEVLASTPEITQRVHHATDEEKLACTGMLSQTADIQEERGEPQCNKAPPKKQTVDKSIDDICLKDDPETKIKITQRRRKSASEMSMKLSTKMASSEGSDAAALSQDHISLSEMDKAAVLTLIREEIITKEIEVSEWKKKYEDSRLEVLEMRNIVAEYEKTVAQMI
ncbi:Transforming acidic coiled-coil-containing protein 1, partial [Dissostichus eleginoides]